MNLSNVFIISADGRKNKLSYKNGVVPTANQVVNITIAFLKRDGFTVRYQGETQAEKKKEEDVAMLAVSSLVSIANQLGLIVEEFDSIESLVHDVKSVIAQHMAYSVSLHKTLIGLKQALNGVN